MWYKDLFDELEKFKNDDNAKQMSSYMQNKFPFLGIKKPQLMSIIKPYLKQSKQSNFDWEFVNECWSKDYREYQYVALEYLLLNKNKLIDKDLSNIKQLVITKSWWETVDGLDAIVGELALKYSYIKDEMIKWSEEKNIWLRRVAIDFQQRYKKDTDTILLEKVIVSNLRTKEFFINKAIGWSLREYSKTNPNWVKGFIEKYSDKLSSLSIREASKYID